MTTDDPTATRRIRYAFRHGPITARIRLCQVRPEHLQATTDPDICFCPQCDQRVVDVRTVDGLLYAASLGDCVAARNALGCNVFGGAIIEYHHPGPLQWDE